MKMGHRSSLSPFRRGSAGSVESVQALETVRLRWRTKRPRRGREERVCCEWKAAHGMRVRRRPLRPPD